MSELVSGSTPEGPGGSAGGTPSESDLPSLQGLGNAVDDPSDPEAAGPNADPTQDEALGDASSGGDRSASDPMPDPAGSTGG
jgi:hypothetical protein